MVLDINRCLLYGDGERFPVARPKRYFAVIDGVIGGDGDGPACPNAYAAGVILSGYNPVAVDCSATRLMGFEPMKVPQLARAFDSHSLPLIDCPYEEIRIASNEPAWDHKVAEISDASTLRFEPHFGWVGQIESRGR